MWSHHAFHVFLVPILAPVHPHVNLHPWITSSDFLLEITNSLTDTGFKVQILFLHLFNVSGELPTES